MKKIIITGATGFIGGFIAAAAVKRGWQVYVAARKSSDLRYIQHLPINLIELNYQNVDQLTEKLLEIKPNYIIHNAGLTKAPSQKAFDEVNADYTENLALASVKSNIGLEKFVFMSSLASYGPADNHGVEVVNASCVPHPVTMYGKSKLKAEQKIMAIVGLPYVILRPTAVYGPREKDLFSVFKMVASGFSMFSGNGKQKLTFVFVADLVEWIMRCTENSLTSKSYFVCDGKTYSSTELNSFISKNLNKKTLKIGLPLWLVTVAGYCSEWVGKLSGKLPALNIDKLNEIKANNWQCDVDPLVEDTGYKAAYFLEDGIKETVNWYKENNWL
ncbi:MAG: NAD(P)-dependent oxidoreductase [Saprospiraceae bacterium]|nr:NAD(P)-dependent oxidoreductase [Saprospiraceae bacterium]